MMYNILKLLVFIYAAGALAYLTIVTYGVFTDKKVSTKIVIAALLFTPLWVIPIYGVIKNMAKESHK